jgi:hypothetical protein
MSELFINIRWKRYKLYNFQQVFFTYHIISLIFFFASCCIYPLANKVAKGYSNATVLPSVRPSHPCKHSKINILQWILTKLGTYLVLKRIWNPTYFQGHRSNIPYNFLDLFFLSVILFWYTAVKIKSNKNYWIHIYKIIINLT